MRVRGEHVFGDHRERHGSRARAPATSSTYPSRDDTVAWVRPFNHIPAADQLNRHPVCWQAALRIGLTLQISRALCRIHVPVLLGH